VGHHIWREGQKTATPWNITHIRVEKDRWSLHEGAREVVSYRIEVHDKKKPCHIDWRGQRGEALWLGLIRRDGDLVDVMYLTASKRPADFENPPTGTYLINLQRNR
jgi:hypothetical protein